MLSCSLRRWRHLSLPQLQLQLPQQQHTITFPALSTTLACTTQRCSLTSKSSSASTTGSANPALIDADAAAAKTPRFCQSQTLLFAAASTAPIRRFTANQHNLLSSARPTTSFSSSSLFPYSSRKIFSPPSGSPAGLGTAYFSTSGAAMGAVKIDGTAIAKRIRENLHAEILEKKKINPRYVPSLKIIQGIFISTASDTTMAY